MNIKSAAVVAAKSLQLCPTLCDPMDCSTPGSCVHGILQATPTQMEGAALPTSYRQVPAKTNPDPSGPSFTRANLSYSQFAIVISSSGNSGSRENRIREQKIRWTSKTD